MNNILSDLFAELTNAGAATSSREFFMLGALMALTEAVDSPDAVKAMVKELSEFAENGN